MEEAKPDWWPANPYPESIFPMSWKQYPKIVTDPELRTALSGALGREFWNIASEAIWAAMVDAETEEKLHEEMNEEETLLPDPALLRRLADYASYDFTNQPPSFKDMRQKLRADAAAARALANRIEGANIDET